MKFSQLPSANVFNKTVDIIANIATVSGNQITTSRITPEGVLGSLNAVCIHSDGLRKVSATTNGIVYNGIKEELDEAVAGLISPGSLTSTFSAIEDAVGYGISDQCDNEHSDLRVMVDGAVEQAHDDIMEELDGAVAVLMRPGSLSSTLSAACFLIGSEINDQVQDDDSDIMTAIGTAVEDAVDEACGLSGPVASTAKAIIDEALTVAPDPSESGDIAKFVWDACTNSGGWTWTTVSDALPEAITNLDIIDSLPEDSGAFYFPCYDGTDVKLISDFLLKEWLSRDL